MTVVTDSEQIWRNLAARMAEDHADILPGKMMSAEALTCKGKVFAFYSTKGGMAGLGLRLGREFDVNTLRLSAWRHLAPFKTKPPMKDWIVCGIEDLARWPGLVETALEIARARQTSR